MATAGSIVVDLLMRTGAFETDTKRAEKRLRELTKTAKDAGKVLGTAIVAGATAAATALKLTIDGMDEMSKAAQKVGLPTEDLSKLSYAAELADVSLETLTTSLGKLTKSQAAALKETSQQAQVFKALGIAIKDADGNLRNSNDVLEDFADRFKTMKGSPEAMAAGFALFGRSFQQLIPLLKDGSAGIKDAGDELESFGGVLSTQAGQQAEEFNDNLTRLTTAAKGLALQVASDLLPDLVALTENWVKLSKDGDTVTDTAHAIADGFRALGSVVEFLTPLWTAFVDVVRGSAGALAGAVHIVDSLAHGNFAGALQGVTTMNEGRDLALFGRDAVGKEGDRRFAKPPSRPDPRFADVLSSQDSLSGSQFASASELQAALQKALAGGGKPKKGGGSKAKAEKSDAEKEAEALQRAYESLNASLKEQVALFGDTTEAAQVRYDLENGELAKLSPALKEELIARAERLDVMREEAELQEELDEANQRQLERQTEVLEAIKEEAMLLGMSADQQEIYNNLKAAGVNANEAFRQSVIDETEALQKAREAAEMWNEIEGELAGTIFDLAKNIGDAENILKDFADSIADMILRSIAEDWAGKITDWFKGLGKAQGTAGAEGGGTNWGGLISSFFSAFSGGRAGGGDAFPGSAYLVGEAGPELFVPRTAGMVLPANRTAEVMAGGTGMQQTVNFALYGRTTQRTQTQMAQTVQMAGGMAVRRNS